MGSSFWRIRGPEGGLTGVLARAKQIAAGAVEGTIANTSETKGNYRPAIVDAVPALVGTIATIAKGKQMDGSNAAERLVNDSMRRAALGSKRTNETLGINDPKDTAELALRVFGGLIVPSTKAGAVAKAVSKVPGGAKVVKAATALPKPVKVAAKVATEVALPLRQTGIGTAAAVAAPITAGLDVILDQQVDPTTGQRYDGSVRDALAIGEANPEVDTATPELDELDTLMLNTGVEMGLQEEPVDTLDMEMAEGPREIDLVAVEEEDKLSRFEQGALAVGAALGGYAVLKASKGFLDARQAAAALPENLPEFTGKVRRTSRGGILTKAKTKFVQQDEPIRNMAEDFLGRSYAKQWGYRADRMTNVSIGSRVKHFFQTGITPTNEARTVKLAPLAEAYAKELSPDEQRVVSDALLAASSLDDYRATGVLSSLNRDKTGADITPAQLEQLVQTVTSNPKLNKYFEGIQKSYDDLLKYRVARGRDTLADYTRLRERRPNYVAMNRNLEGDAPFEAETRRYSANNDQGLGAARSLEEGGGVQGTSGVGNPFLSLFDEWANEIRRSDLNDLRADFLVNMDASGALNGRGKKLIEMVTPDRTDDDIHRVRINGKERAFKVRDPEVARALHMSPRATVKFLEGMRQVTQQLTTGPAATLFNFFAAAKSPIYDAMIANVARPKGVKLGLMNRTFLGGYTGAARYMWDDMRGAIGTTLRDNMIREHSWLKSILGENNLDNLASVFESAYENSIKADLDRLGISSATMHGSPDASELISGAEQIAPHFADAAQRAVRSDIATSLDNGDITAFKAVLETSKSLYAQAKGGHLARVYGSLIEGLHNGVRYSAYAANKPARGQIQNMDKLISDMRRLSADSSQHGGHDLYNKTLGSLMYANLGMQSLYEVGKRAIENPATFMLNVTTTLGTMAAMHYAAIGSDPVAMEKHKAKTPQQKATSLTTFGGAELPLDPITRFMVAATFPIYDHMSGLTSGEYNPNFFSVMESWLDGEIEEMSESAKKEQSIGLWEAVKANNPFSPSSLPIANIALASAGVDPGMSRMTDDTVMEQTQRLTGLEDDTRRPDALGTAHMENMISAIGSTAGRSMYQIVDDMYRAFGKNASLSEALDVGLSRWKDNAQKGAALGKPIFFNGYANIESASDTNYQLLRDREPGIEQAIKIMTTDSALGGRTTTKTPKRSGWMPQEEGVGLPPEVDGTELGYIAGMTSQMENMYLKPHREVLSKLGKQVEAYNSFYVTPIEDRNVSINKINEQRRYQRLMILTRVRSFEEKISDRIGRPFTYKDFNPKDYLTPMPQPAQ